MTDLIKGGKGDCHQMFLLEKQQKREVKLNLDCPKIRLRVLGC